MYLFAKITFSMSEKQEVKVNVIVLWCIGEFHNYIYTLLCDEIHNDEIVVDDIQPDG